MPDTEGVKISLLPSATNLADANILAGVQGNVTKKFSLSAIKTWLNAVPQSRKINNKALTSDIELDASDVGARGNNWLPSLSDIGAEAEIQLGSISLSSSWSGSGPYFQTVTVTGATVTANSKVDIQLTASQIATLIGAGVTGMVIENNNGTLTAWTVGASPSSMTVQCTVEEIE